MELEYFHTYFDDPSFLEFLKSQNFELGIGAAYSANQFLFKALDIPYIIIHPEDVEGDAL